MLIKDILENHFKDVCDIEFVVQEGKLYILNTRIAKRTPKANLRFALQFFQEGKIGIDTVLTIVKPVDIEDIVSSEVLNKSSLNLIGTGLPASIGIATGKIVLCASDVESFARRGEDVIFVKVEVNPEDIGAIRLSRGVLTARGGMTSHASIACRGLNKPCVAGFGQMEIVPSQKQVIISGRGLLKEGDWITINGNTGSIYTGKGEIIARDWRNFPEVVAISQMIENAVISNEILDDVVGPIWRIRDYLIYSMPLRRGITQKNPVLKKCYKSFITPKKSTTKVAQSHLVQISHKENYSQIVLGLSESISRLLSASLGIGQHHHYFRPLWDPQKMVKIKYYEDEYSLDGTQFVGFEYFDINRYVPHLLDISHITFFLEVILKREIDRWFLDFTNPNGESLVTNSDVLSACVLFVNDAKIQHDELPLFYNAIRRREYYWRWFEYNKTSYDEIVTFLRGWKEDKIEDRLSIYCEELGLIREKQLTIAGQSLIGKRCWSRKYEFTNFK